MAGNQPETEYRLKLREGDVIQATVTKVGAGEVQIETSLWSNIESATIVETGANTSIAPGAEIYATVTDISGETATLTQKRGVYRRNHLPGDSLRMQAMDHVSASVCQATLDQFRNLDTVYIIGVPLGADVTATLAKIRDGTAFALPTTIHDRGLAAGRTLQVSTTAGSTRATIATESGLNALDLDGRREVPVELADPAWTTGPATAEITATDADPPKATVVDYPTELPQPGDQLTTTVTEGEDYTKVRLDEAPLELTVQLRHDPPVSGRATIDLQDRADGFYQGEITEYVDPAIRVGQTHDARLYASRNRAKIESGDRDITITIRDEIATTGQGPIKIVEISDEIYGRSFGNIKPLAGEEEQASGVDMTDVSKF